MNKLLHPYIPVKALLFGLIQFALFLFPQGVHCQSFPLPLEQYLSDLPEDIKVSFQASRIDGTPYFSLNEDQQVPSASIIKAPILIYLFTLVDEGKLDLEEVIELAEKDTVGGAGLLQEMPEGSRFTWKYLAGEMIRVSDNTATNLIIGRLGMENIQEWLKKEGFEETHLARMMMDFDAIAAGRQNYISSRDINKLFVGLGNGQWLSEGSRKEALFMLKNCEDKAGIPGKLPFGTEVAHKTGTLDYVRGDAGIVFGDTPVVLSVFVEGFGELSEADDIIGEISRMVVEEVNVKKK